MPVRENGGIIGKANTPTSTVASGIWGLPEQSRYKRAGLWPSVPLTVEYLVIAGGGGAGGNSGGAGGAGGYRSSVVGENSGGGASAEPRLNLSTGTSYSITIGAGGTGLKTTGELATSGSISLFSTISSLGGGTRQATGGSGGGAPGGGGTIGAGTTGQGFSGGSSSSVAGGGGGGAGAPGGNASSGNAGSGGVGVASSITGTSVFRAGGGGGGGASAGGSGGNGGGGAGKAGSASMGTETNGVENTGGGAGSGYSAGGTNGNGGSGVVILKYPDVYTISNPGGGLTMSTAAPSGGFKVTTITQGTGNVSWS